MRNRLWSVLMVTIMTLVMIFVVLIKDQTRYIALEGRQANQFFRPTPANVMSGEFQDNFELAYKDQLVGRESLFKVYKRLDSLLEYISSRTHEPYSLYKIGDNVYRFDAAKDYLVEFPVIRSDASDAKIVDVANNINSLSNRFSDVDFYVYDAFRLNMIDWFDKDNFIHSAGMEQKSLFKNSLSDKVHYVTYVPADIDEYMGYYYKSDPHWNAFGSYEVGYKKIVDMFNEKYGDLEYLVPYDTFTYSDYKYWGQYGRASLMVTGHDTFIDLKFDMPAYRTIVNGEEKRYDWVDEYENGTVESYLMPYIYSNLHGNDEKEVEFIFDDNNTGRNLLCFVDSYASPIKYLVASHFDRAVFIDLRIYRDLDIAEYIERYDITDVLYLEYGGTLYDSAFMINTD